MLPGDDRDFARHAAKEDADDLRGLVYSLTPHVAKDEELPWYAQPGTLAIAVLAATVVLNIIFW